MKNLKKYGTGIIILPMVLLILSVGLMNCSKKDNTTTPPTERPEVVISPQPLYFGHIPEGHSATRELIISNIGGEALNISSLNIEGNNAGLFSFGDSVGQITVPAFNKIVLALEFAPASMGDFSAHITIESNAGSSPDQANLTGHGTSASGNMITFERIKGGIDADSDGSVRITSNGGYIIAGSTTDQANEWAIASLIRTDRYGNILWDKTYSETGPARFNSIVIADDGGYVAVGNTRTSETSKQSIYILKTDSDGNKLWTTIPDYGLQDDEVTEIEKTSDGGYIISGRTQNTTGTDIKNALLIKINSSGTEEWHHMYGTTEGEEANSVKQTSDNGFIFVGSTTSGPSDFNIYMVKTDASGNTSWEKTIGSSGWENASSVILTADGGYALTGYTLSEGAGLRDVMVIKADQNGDILWTQTYGGSRNDAGAAIIQTNDQGFLVVGRTESFGEGLNDLFIVKMDNSGNQSWQRTYGGANEDGASCVREHSGGGFIISGSTSSFSKDNDVYFLRLNAQGLLN